jgi:hypothetical protein
VLGLFSIQCPVRYKIVNKIFEGGMGVVYEAEQHGASGFIKRVAIKVIRQSYANQKLFIENFIGEAKLVADLIHTNIVQTYLRHLGLWEAGVRVDAARDPPAPAEPVIEPWLDDPFPDYDTEPVTMYASN